MAAKHARHKMRKDKNLKGSDPSEASGHYLFCGFVTMAQSIEHISWFISVHI